MAKRIVVVGGGAAGATAAAKAKRMDPEAEVVLVEAGPYVTHPLRRSLRHSAGRKAVYIHRRTVRKGEGRGGICQYQGRGGRRRQT